MREWLRSRKWWRFRLSTLLIGVAIAGIWFSVQFVREPLSLENVSDLRQRARIDVDVWKVTWNAAGDRVAILGWETPVHIHDAVTLWQTDTIGEGKKIIHFAFSPDEDIVAYCENQGQPCIVNLRTDSTIVLDTDVGQSSLQFSPDGKWLASGQYGKPAMLWNVQTGELVFELDIGPTSGGLTPVFSPDGKRIAIGNRNSTTRIFDVKSGQQLIELPTRESQELLFHPTRPVIAVAYCDGSIRLWNTENGELLHQVQTTAQEIYTLDWSPDGKILASAGLRGDIDLWNGENLNPVHTIDAPEWVISVRFRPDMRGLFIAGGDPLRNDTRFVKELVVPSLAQQLFWKNETP